MAKRPNIMDRVSNLLGRSRDLAAEVQADMDSLQADLREKQAERARIADLPITDDAIKARIASALDLHAVEAASRFQPTLIAAPNGRADLRPLMPAGGGDHLGALVLLGFGDQIADRLFAMAKLRGGDGIGEDDRAAKLARIDAEINTLGRTIERLRRAASASLGIDVPVAEGADPAHWLAPDVALDAEDRA